MGRSHAGASEVRAFADRLDHWGVAITPASDVVDLTGARSLEEMPERVHEVKGVDVVSHLLTAIAEYHIRCVRHCALCEISEKTVQLRPRVTGTCQATTTEAHGLHTEISPVFLN